MDKTKFVLLGFLVVFGAVSPWLGGMNPYYYDILIGIGINIILAAGLNLVNGYTGQFSLGHAGFMAVGAYLGSALSLAIKLPFPSFPDWSGSIIWWIPKALLVVILLLCDVAVGFHNGVIGVAQHFPGWGQFLAALLYGGIGAAVAGLLVGIPSLRLKGDYLAIVTLGFNEIIKGIIQNAEPLGAQRGLGGMAQYTNFFWTFAFAGVTIYAVLSLVHSTYGRGFLAVRDDEIAAEAMGINTTKYKVLAFVLGAFFAGIAGGLYAHFKQFIHPEGFNFMKSVDVVVMVILGGMGSTAGVCVAAALLTILPEILRTVSRIESLPAWLQGVAENRMILYSLLLIILMLTRPQGLFGVGALKKTKKGMSAPLLKLDNVTVRFGGLKAVSELSFEIAEGELVGLIGPNGAGKTTVFNLITGVYQPTSGAITFAGKSVVGHRPYKVTARGIARTFQNIRLFSSLSVLDNVRTACNMHLKHGISHALFRGPKFCREEAEVEKTSRELLEIFGLTTECDVSCKSLPYGDQRRLEIVRALATRPKLLLLDEPAAGMNPTEKAELMKLIRFTQEKFGLAVLLVEHDMKVVMGICQRINVLDYGKKIAEGTPAEIRSNPEVIEAYLGS